MEQNLKAIQNPPRVVAPTEEEEEEEEEDDDDDEQGTARNMLRSVV